jgi:hypothetical protein
MASMSQQSLHTALARLQQELQGAPPLDSESRRLLDELTGEISRAREAAPSDSHASRLEALAVKFEAGHPDLAASLRGIADALGRIGL